MKNITFRDSTIREGIETPGLDLETKDKVKLALSIEKLGVKEIEIQSPNEIKNTRIIGEELKKAGSKLITTGFLFSWLPISVLKDQLNELKDSVDRFIITIPGSKSHLKLRNTNIAETIKNIWQMADLLKSYDKDLELGIMDAMTADIGDFTRLITQFEKDIHKYVLYDTTGRGTPNDFSIRVSTTRSINKENRILVHAHNDFGTATINTVTGILAGADGADTVVLGLGDRAGNASFEEVVISLELQYSIDSGIRKSELNNICREVAEKFQISIPPLKPAVGENAFCHETDLHIEGVYLNSSSAFEPYDPICIGSERTFIFSGSEYEKTKKAIASFYNIDFPDESSSKKFITELRNQCKIKGRINSLDIQKIKEKLQNEKIW